MLPTREDIEALSRENVIVRHCLQMHALGEVDFGQALILAVLAMAEADKLNDDAASEVLQQLTPIYIERIKPPEASVN